MDRVKFITFNEQSDAESNRSLMKYILLILLFTSYSMQVISQEYDCALDGQEVFTVAEQPPVFGTCEELVMTKRNSYQCSDENIKAYIAARLRQVKITAPVSIEVILNKSGEVCSIKAPLQNNVEDVKRLKDVIANMPQWTPAKQRGRAVNIRVQITYSNS